MTFSTSANPRLGQTPTALTSLGAVGGPRGAGAGALRILVEFLSTYDAEATKQLELDLARIDQAAQVSAAAEEKRQNKLLQVRGKLAEAQKLIAGSFSADNKRELKQIEALGASRSITHRKQAAELKESLALELERRKFTAGEIDILLNRIPLRREEAKLLRQQASGEATQSRLAKERLSIEERLEQVQRRRGAVAPRLQGLALGLIGGALGAAVIGGAFTAISAVVDNVVEKIQDIVDPARHAREALEGVAKAINEIAVSEGLSILSATGKFLEQIGIKADEATTALLAQAAVDQRALEILQKQNEAYDIIIHNKAQENALTKEATLAFEREAAARGLITQQGLEFFDVGDLNLLIDGLTAEEIALRNVSEAQRLAAEEGLRLKAIQDALAFTAARTAAAQEILAASFASFSAAQVGPLQNQLSNLSVQPSRRTRRLERAVEAGSGGSGIGEQLRNIAEERSLILLRQRLRLLGTAINLERFSGKFLLEAINAKIAALQKENREQDRLNQLLDLQFRMSQTIRRSQGESVSDFLARRAQENRALLAEADDLERQRRIDRLEDLRTKVQDEVALAELAEQRKNALASAGAAARQKSLQKELEASRKHDKEVFEAKKKALEARIKAEEKAFKEAEELTQESVFTQNEIYIRGIKNIEDILIAEGKIQGYKRAKATIQAMVDAFAIPAFIAQPFIDRINRLIATFEARASRIRHEGSGEHGFAHGGVIELNNASSVFGSNIRTGEGGTELGVILSNKVAAILQKQKGVEQIGPFIINGTEDPLRDRYAFARSVKEAVSEALA